MATRRSDLKTGTSLYFEESSPQTSEQSVVCEQSPLKYILSNDLSHSVRDPSVVHSSLIHFKQQRIVVAQIWIPPIEHIPVHKVAIKPLRNEFDPDQALAAFEAMDIFVTSPPRNENHPLPRVESFLKKFLLQFFLLPHDLRLPYQTAQQIINNRIRSVIGKAVEPCLIVRLLETLKRAQSKFKTINELLFGGCNWDFEIVENLPLCWNLQFLE